MRIQFKGKGELSWSRTMVRAMVGAVKVNLFLNNVQQSYTTFHNQPFFFTVSFDCSCYLSNHLEYFVQGQLPEEIRQPSVDLFMFKVKNWKKLLKSFVIDQFYDCSLLSLRSMPKVKKSSQNFTKRRKIIKSSIQYKEGTKKSLGKYTKI